MVLVSTKDKIKIYTFFLKEGVISFQKDHMAKNIYLDVPNLHIFLVLRSLASRKYATEIFLRQWHYYILNDDGIKYLREYLGLPETYIPKTKIKEENPDQEEENNANAPRRQRDDGDRRGPREEGRGGRGGR